MGEENLLDGVEVNVLVWPFWGVSLVMEAVRWSVELGGGGLVGGMGTDIGDRTGGCNISWDGLTILFVSYISAAVTSAANITSPKIDDQTCRRKEKKRRTEID